MTATLRDLRSMYVASLSQGVCKSTGKLSFPTHAAARSALDTAALAAAGGSARRRESRIYVCPDCASYHLTAHPKAMR